jgi:hypothetical protein
MDLFCDGKITKVQFILAVMIDAYVTRGGPGCWATNAHLANKLRVTPHAVSQAIKELVLAGHLKRYWIDGQRYLEASWSRLLDPTGERISTSTAGARGGSTGRATRSSSKMNRVNTPEDTTYLQGLAEPPDGVPPAPVKSGSSNPAKPSTSVTERGSLPVNPLRLCTCPPSPKDKAVKCPVEPIDRARARRLKDCVRQGKTVTAISASPKNWEQAMAVLRRKIDACATQKSQSGQHVIDAVLDFVVNHHNPSGAKPHIRHARELIDRWDWITDLVAKAERNKPVPVSDDARDIVRRLSMMGWPKGSESRLPQAVQKSLEEFRKFRAAVKALADGNPGATKGERLVREFAGRVYRQHLLDDDWFVGNYFERVHDRVRNWADWSGDLDRYIFNPKLIAQEGMKWAEEYHRAELWDRLITEVNREG